MGERTADRPDSKVARLLEEYDLEGFGAEMEARWTADDDRMSLRALADLLNERLLERTLLDAGASAPPSDVGTTYENLTADGVSTGVRMDTRSRLERAGVDVEELERNFVTYQAVRTYLREWRGAEYERHSDTEKVEKDRRSIQRLLGRTRSVVEDRIGKLRDTGRIAVGPIEVVLDLRILCQACGSQYPVTELLERGGCECRGEGAGDR